MTSVLGKSLRNPTVSVIMTSVSLGNRSLRLDGSSVAKSLSSVSTRDLVR